MPYIGPAIAVGTLGAVGLLTYPTLGEAVVAPLEFNPFAVFLAIAFCTWLWGPVGAFLAVPF